MTEDFEQFPGDERSQPPYGSCVKKEGLLVSLTAAFAQEIQDNGPDNVMGEIEEILDDAEEDADDLDDEE